MKDLIKLYILAFLFCLSFSLTTVSCAKEDVLENAYKTLKTAEELYVATKSAANELYTKNLITNEEAKKINEAAKVYRDSFDAAKLALENYKIVMDMTDKSIEEEKKLSLTTSLGLLKDNYDSLKSLMQPYFAKLGKKDVEVNK